MTDFVNKEIKKAIDLRKSNGINESLKILNNLLNEELEENDKAYIFFEISKCHYSSKDIMTALVFIEKALRINPEISDFYFWKGICYSRIHDFFSYASCLFKSIDLSDDLEFNEACYIDILKAANTYFDNFNSQFVDEYLYFKHINCFQRLSKIEIAPEEIRQKYLIYKKECLSNLKEKIDSEFIHGSEDEFYTKKLDFCRQFLEIEEISREEKLEIIKKYAEAKSILRYFYGYKLEEDFSDVSKQCNIGDIILENGKVVSNCNELDLVTGIILRENEKLLVIDAYERERESPCPGFTKEYNGWHMTDSKELELILKNKEKLDNVLNTISGAKNISDKPRYIKYVNC